MEDAKILSNKKITEFYINTLDHQEIISSIDQSKIFKDFLNGEKTVKDINDFFLTISKPDRYTHQLRFIDINGKEIVRIDKDDNNKSFIVKQKSLQNKKNRYYFKEIISLNEGQIWYSNVDLNVEHGKIEQPIRPTLRIGLPVYNKSKKVGILIVNISIKHFLQKLTRDKKFDIFVIDKDGEYLYHKDEKIAWSRYLKNNQNVYKNLKFLKQEDLTIESKYINNHNFQKLFLDNKENLYLVIKIKDSVLNSLYSYYHNLVLLVLLLTLVITVAIILLIFSKKEKNITEQLLKSEKMVSMGEMIGNIAHQWRQPLSVISTAATGMLTQKEFGVLEDKEFEKNCKVINTNAQYLSNTIDDFRNFITNKREKSYFNLTEDINSFLSLVEGTKKANQIRVILELDDNIEINGFKNELIQCFINIFNNSRDAFKEKESIKNRYIFISSYLEDEHAVIVMQDNASGIPKDIIRRIFEPYFTTKHKSQGTGLGLHMTYNLIVEGMKGSIDVKNTEFRHKGEEHLGARFTIKIPLNPSIN